MATNLIGVSFTDHLRLPMESRYLDGGEGESDGGERLDL